VIAPGVERWLCTAATLPLPGVIISHHDISRGEVGQIGSIQCVPLTKENAARALRQAVSLLKYASEVFP
jgi:hypothetical protein